MKYILLVILFGLGTMFALSILSRKTPDTLGVHDNQLSACPASKNCVGSQSPDAASAIDPIPMNGTVENVMERLGQTLTTMGGAVVESKGNYLWATFSSPLWQFKDDLECLYDEKNGVVHVRSASRVGYHDFGANRKRLETLRHKVAVQGAKQ